MPRKERNKKKKERERQQAAKGSSSLTSWIRPVCSREEEKEGSSNSDVEREAIDDVQEFAGEQDTGASAGELPEGDAREESQYGTASVDQENVMETGAGELPPDETREESQYGTAANKEDVIAKLVALNCPTDPAHMQTFNINYSDRYIQMCEKVGPCQPVMTFPKNTDGRSFQRRWYTDRPWLEYSPKNDAMYCFSCRIFLREEKFKNKTAWKTVGIDTWRSATGKIKEHASTEAHMMSMVRWNIYSKKALQAAFDTSDIQGRATRERERQRNREILTRLIDITLYLA